MATTETSATKSTGLPLFFEMKIVWPIIYDRKANSDLSEKSNYDEK
jgi:hypothetical protein